MDSASFMFNTCQKLFHSHAEPFSLSDFGAGMSERGTASGSASPEFFHVRLQPHITFLFDDSADEGRQMLGYTRSYSTHWC